MDRSPIRETGSYRPTPSGDFDGTTRRQVLEDLLAKHRDAEIERTPAHAYWTKRLRRVLSVAFVLAAAWPLTPQEAADVLRPHQYVAPITDGPRVYTTNSTPGASSWMAFPPERPRLRLDGTPLTQPPDVYGGFHAGRYHHATR